MQSKLLSIIVPIYNGEKFVSACITKLLNNPYPNFEILIGDDGSTDYTWKEISKFTADSRVKTIKFEKNQGAGAMRNRLLAEAKGEYVALQDIDDDFEMDRFVQQVKYLEENKADAVGSYAQMQEISTLQNWRLLTVPTFPKFKDWFFLKSVVHASLLVRRICLDKVVYHNTLKIGEDYYFLVQLYLKKIKIINIPKPLYIYRIESSRFYERNFNKILQLVNANWEISKLWPWYLTVLFLPLHTAKLIAGWLRSKLQS